MSRLRTGDEDGTGIISSLVGVLFICFFLISVTKITEIILLTQRLDALASSSVRKLSVASAQGNAQAITQTESQISDSIPLYRNQLSYHLSTTTNFLVFSIFINDYSITVWPGLSLGPYRLKGSAAARIEY